ncbi:DUF6702 family protein [Olivibacter sitiensis]|uniref:DUF6702 family protein n=1 Tax=Olivibacter sitiensis TaxID=376470 RepID=UPI0003F91BF5|nr:DUF6702 family protein [Olivibacter sitiensis]
MTKLLIVLFSSLLHPFYVSIFTINQDKDAKNLEISCRIFFDDLEDALEKEHHKKVDLVKGGDKEKTDEYLSAYFKKNLRIQANGKILSLQYLGYSIEDDAAWCFLEANDVGTIKEMTVLNSVLYTSHEKQSNILHVTIGGVRKSTKLDNPKTKASFSF